MSREAVRVSNSRDVEAQAVVGNEERVLAEQGKAVFDLPRPKRKGLPGKEVLRADAVDGGGFIKKPVRFDVEEQGGRLRGGYP